MIAAALKAIASPAGRLVAAALAGAVLVAGIYQTGVNAERKHGEAATLRQTVETLQRQQETALEIQTRQAQRMAELRVAMQQREEAPMRWSGRFGRSLLLALALSAMLSGCGSGQSGLDLRVPIPRLHSAVREPCRDPGVDGNAKVALAQHRRALADCEDKRAAAVEHGDRVMAGFGMVPAKRGRD